MRGGKEALGGWRQRVAGQHRGLEDNSVPLGDRSPRNMMKKKASLRANHQNYTAYYKLLLFFSGLSEFAKQRTNTDPTLSPSSAFCDMK